MRLEPGIDVYTSDDEKIGSIERVVIDPRTAEITHIVIRKGFLFVEDKVIPADYFQSMSSDRVVLRSDVGSFEDMPRFEYDYFVRSDTGERIIDEAAQQEALYWYPPYFAPDMPYLYPAFSGEPGIRVHEQNIPDGTVALKKNIKVLSSDNQHIGNVEHIFTDAQGNQVTHFLVSDGFILKEKKVVPIWWVSHITQDHVHLAVRHDIFEKLPKSQEVF